MSNLLKNKTVLITGVTGGIGLEVCKKFYEKDATLSYLGEMKNYFLNYLENLIAFFIVVTLIIWTKWKIYLKRFLWIIT